MSDQVDQEVQAIKAVLAALSPLSEKARASVLEYVVRRLDVPSIPGSGTPGRGHDPLAPLPPPPSGTTQHIKDFKVQKGPRSANEMAALVAYYLANLAPETERKKTVNQDDIETYFKIGEFPYPRILRVTLPNAKAAGYFDYAGEGEYRLNAVGHNLVAHAMPRRGAKEKAARRSSRRKAPSASTRRRKRSR